MTFTEQTGRARSRGARAVFLDRAGVLNKAIVREGKPFPPASLAELEIVADAPDCLRRLRAAGYLLIVVTNQPDLSRGTQTREAVERIHAALRAAMPLDAIYVCDHDGSDGCECRKPKPGMLLTASRDFGIDLAQSFLIGDRWRDIDAGAQAGCRTVLLDFRYAERAPETAPARTAASLRDAVDWILNSGVTED
jgi:D-glycero-D-manno-heptose 1,7-bisphosphate phosphatase